MPEDARAWKDALYGQFARVGKALASPRRLELLDLLGQGPKNVEILAREVKASVANVSQHLQVLSRARLVTPHRAGTFVFYQLADPSVAALLSQVHGVSEGVLAEVRELRTMHLVQHDMEPPVTLEELRNLVETGEVYLIDVRPASEYAAGHLPRAISVPLSGIEEHFRHWSGSQPIVVYCRGRYCLFARYAVDALRQQGLSARRTDVGVLDWPIPAPGG